MVAEERLLMQLWEMSIYKQSGIETLTLTILLLVSCLKSHLKRQIMFEKSSLQQKTLISRNLFAKEQNSARSPNKIVHNVKLWRS